MALRRPRPPLSWPTRRASTASLHQSIHPTCVVRSMNVASETVAIIGVADGQPTLAAWALAEAQDTGAVLIFRLGRRARYAGTYDLSLCVACCSWMHGDCAM